MFAETCFYEKVGVHWNYHGPIKISDIYSMKLPYGSIHLQVRLYASAVVFITAVSTDSSYLIKLLDNTRFFSWRHASTSCGV